MSHTHAHTLSLSQSETCHTHTHTHSLSLSLSLSQSETCRACTRAHTHKHVNSYTQSAANDAHATKHAQSDIVQHDQLTVKSTPTWISHTSPECITCRFKVNGDKKWNQFDFDTWKLVDKITGFLIFWFPYRTKSRHTGMEWSTPKRMHKSWHILIKFQINMTSFKIT